MHAQAHHFKPHPRLGKPLFYLNCLGPILAVTATSLAVYLLGGGNKPPYNIPTVKPLPAGIASFGSLTQLQLSGPDCAAAASIGIVAALIALAEASAIARMFATLESYEVDGIREMVALGMANIAGSFSSTYVVTGSFSRSAVNYNSGGKTALTNVIMSALVLVTLVAVTPAFQYLPTATLSAIIIVAVAGLVDFTAMALILKTDKVDFLITLGTALGILFVSMEIGLLIGVLVSMVSFFIQVARPKMPTLGLIKGTGVYRSVEQYGDAEEAEGVWVMRVDGPLLFPSASYVRQRVLRAVERSTRGDEKRITVRNGCIRSCGDVGMWACGHVGMWAWGHVGMWAWGHVSMWACGHVSMGACGHVGMWAWGHVGMWACGHGGMWTCAFAHVSVCCALASRDQVRI
ncbi:unnamed protein product [Closterium sp. NIES-53]